MEDSRARRLWLPLVMAATAIGLAACGDEGGTTTDATETGTTTTAGGEPILIKTHVIFLKVPDSKVGAIGDVLPGSTLGDSAFCAGGKFSDRRGAPPLGSVVKTFRCPDGRLTITFSPTGSNQKQSSAWRVVNGSGSFEELSGGGRTKAVFESNGGAGRETFTGTVTR